MSQTRSNIRSVGDILARKGRDFAFIDPPMISAPSTQILQANGSPRLIADPSQTHATVFGNDTIIFPRVEPVPLEKGTNGEVVFKCEDDRVRFVGTWINASSGNGTRPETSTVSDYMEVTFWGTGLNLLLSFAQGAAVDVRATVDGGTESANLIPLAGSMSTVLNGRLYRANICVQVAANLTPGVHTVKLRHVANGFSPSGVQVVTDSTQLRTLKGEIYSSGRKYGAAADTLHAYDSGFDGAPSLNGRGGRVAIYRMPDGRLGKVIQQTDPSSLYLNSASHANEECYYRKNWRDFGASRSDDFSTLSTSAGDRAFTMEDCNVSLVGHNVLNDSGEDGFRLAGVSGNFVYITFTGTGLDVLTYEDGPGTQQTADLIIDGSTVSSTYATPLLGNRRIQKIASGLPYGTHTVTWNTTTSATGNFHLVDFLIYVPKRPTLPAGAVLVDEYFLNATYVANTNTGILPISQGVSRIENSRHHVYIDNGGSWVASLAVSTFIGGQSIARLSGSAVRKQVVFTGTGFELRGFGSSDRPTSVTMEISTDGVNYVGLNSTNFPTAAFAATGYAVNGAAGTYNPNNGLSSVSGASLRISNLPLDTYTIRFTQATAGANWGFDVCDVITPIHVPARSNRHEGMSIRRGVQPLVNLTNMLDNADINNPKVLLSYDAGNTRILSSRNISAVIRVATGRYVIQLEKPFKHDRYTATAHVARRGTIGGANFGSFVAQVNALTPQQLQVDVFRTTDGGEVSDEPFTLICFGELDNEDT